MRDVVNGYCLVPVDATPEDCDVIEMDSLIPGDRFLFVRGDDPAVDVCMDESAPMDQRMDLWRGMVERARAAGPFTYQSVDAPSEWGGAGCVALGPDTDTPAGEKR